MQACNQSTKLAQIPVQVGNICMLQYWSTNHPFFQDKLLNFIFQHHILVLNYNYSFYFGHTHGFMTKYISNTCLSMTNKNRIIHNQMRLCSTIIVLRKQYDKRQATYVQHNIEAVRCFRLTIFAVKMQQILHILSAFVDLGIQHAMHMGHIVICGMSDATIFFHIIS